jgi:hypothetical protein
MNLCIPVARIVPMRVIPVLETDGIKPDNPRI